MKFCVSYNYKAFPINLNFLNIVGKHFVQNARKVHKKGHKKFFHFKNNNVYNEFVVSFFYLIIGEIQGFSHH